LTQAQLEYCLTAGATHIDGLLASGPLQLFMAGEMGIGNTTAATAIGCVLTGCHPEQMTGRGTGLDDEGLSHKQHIIEAILRHHGLSADEPLEVLRCLGGFELAAICGAVIRCAQVGVPVLVDGFVVTAAVLVAVKLQPDVAGWLHWAHQSAEPGHQLMMEALDASPLCHFGMRLGEGSGAATVLPLLRMACAIHGRMHTFEEAGVANREP